MYISNRLIYIIATILCVRRPVKLHSFFDDFIYFQDQIFFPILLIFSTQNMCQYKLGFPNVYEYIAISFNTD